MDLINTGIGFDDEDVFFDTPTSTEHIEMDSLTVESILSSIQTGIGLDISKNHTGICIWENGEVKLYGFKLNEYDSSDYHAEYRMRLDFKNRLKEIVKGKHFDLCVVEDVYGGDNFDTTRKLLALNTVIDELIFDGVCSCDEFIRWQSSKWLSGFRMIHKVKGKLKSKFETQAILGYLNFGFYLQTKDLSESEKCEIFFEDKCDATAMLCGVIMKKNSDISVTKRSVVKMADIKMVYIEYMEDSYNISDKRIQDDGFVSVSLTGRNVENSILRLVKENPDLVYCAYLPVSKLGSFGLKHNFTFYDSGEGYLFFYKK